MDAITVVTRNFVGFTTLVKASDNDAVSYAAWADLDDDYVYFYWCDDTTFSQANFSSGNTSGI